MKPAKSVTSQVLAAIKKAGVATRKDLAKFATKKDLENLATKSDLVKFATKTDVVDIVLASERRLKRRMGKQEREITDLMVKLAETTPTRKEFNVLKEQVEFLTPY